LEAAKVIKEFMDDRCCDCDRIRREDAYEHVMDNPPEPMYTIMTVRQLRSLENVDEKAKVLLRRTTE